MLHGVLPEIVTNFGSQDHFNNELYERIIRQTLKEILPNHLFLLKEDGRRDKEEEAEQLHALLPYIARSTNETFPGNLSFFVISRYRSNAFRFFFEMITQWLVPGKRMNAVSLFAADFWVPDISNQLYTLCEVVIRIDDSQTSEHINRNLSTIEAEIRLGMESSYYARRILKVKGISEDEKTVLVQEHIALLIKRLPKHFDYDLMAEMQHLFVMCRDDFRATRESCHLTRMVSILFLFRKDMKERLKLPANTRHVHVKLFRAQLNSPNGKKSILGIIVGVNFLRDKEVFEKRHLLAAIRRYVPDAKTVEGSYITNRRGHEPFCHIYLEIEKPEGKKFTSSEIAALRQELPLELKDQIEHPAHPVFMPRNEEEIMRNVLVLSSQIKYVRDIPQVMVNFDEQTPSHLTFNVIFVHVLKPGAQSLQEAFSLAKTPLEYIPERTKMVGFLRNKYSKEALTFRVKLPKEPFLRRDHSLDLYKARQTVIMELSRLVGDIRDFNGGMIAKQNEVLDGVRELLAPAKYNEHLLENLFFSIMPPVIRTLMEPVAIKNLFAILQELVDRESAPCDRFSHIFQVAADFVFVVISDGSLQLRDEIAKNLALLDCHASEVATSFIRIHEVPYIGYIYRCDDSQKQIKFCQAVENTINAQLFKKSAKVPKEMPLLH